MPKYESMYEERFSYIDDDNLRKHMWDTLEFIVHILAISSKFPEKARNYFYKTCILYTASIIESQIHFCIKKMGHKEIEKEKAEKQKKLDEEKKAKEEKERIEKMDMKILAMLIDLQEDNKKMVEELSIKATSSVDKSSFTFLEELYGKR